MESLSTFTAQSDILELRMRHSLFVDKVVPFSSWGQQLQAFATQDTSSVLDILPCSPGALVVKHDQVPDDETLMKLLQEDLEMRLSFNWALPTKPPAYRVGVVGGRGMYNDDEGMYGSRGFFEAAHALGVSMIVIDEPDHWLADAKYAWLREDFIAMDMSKLGELPRNMATALKHRHIDGIVTFTDDFVIATAEVAEMMGLPTEPSKAMRQAHYKHEMRALVNKTNIQAVHLDSAAQLDDDDDAALAATLHSLRYPLIVKPSRGLLSRGVQKVADAPSMRRAVCSLAQDGLAEHGILIETYVDGPELDANFVLRDGRVLFLEVTDNMPCLGDVSSAPLTDNFMETVQISSSALPHTEKDVIRASLHDNLLRLGFRSGVFHVEARMAHSAMHYRPDRSGVVDLAPRATSLASSSSSSSPASPPDVFLIEVNAREPGTAGTWATLYTYGVDLGSLQLLRALGEREGDRFAALAAPFAFPEDFVAGGGGGAQYWTAHCIVPIHRDDLYVPGDLVSRVCAALPDVAPYVSRAELYVPAGTRVSPTAGSGWMAYFLLFSRESREHLLLMYQRVTDVSKRVLDQMQTNGASHDPEPKPLGATVVDLFDAWAARDPERLAAEWQGEQLTYAELRASSLHVSRALLSAGVRPRDRVPLLTEMSLAMLPTVIGILRVGACYVPIDVVAWSSARIESILAEIRPSVAVVTSPCPSVVLPPVTVNFQKAWLHAPFVDDDDHISVDARLNDIRNAILEDDLAWIVFTSGTTGKPKGVMIYHRGIYAVSKVKMGDELGGSLVMASPSNFPEVSSTCALLSMTPSMLATMDPAGPYDCVRHIFLGGEAPALDVVRQWITPSRKVMTTYGPSETTVTISFGELKPDEEPPFGELIPGVEVVLVDEDLKECDEGEVLIAGPGLAAGYLNNPQLTAQKFIQWNGKRFYRTGDLARRTAGGQLVWAGRSDSLVKNRGFLINLDTEVEASLRSYDPVLFAVAFMWRGRLVGCVQPATVDVDALRQFMKDHNDPFVIPDILLAMDGFPLRPNGKTDRDALKLELDTRSEAGQGVLDQGSPASIYDILCSAYSTVLQIPFQQVNKDSSFTAQGGNSLAAIRLASFLKKHEYPVSVIQILRLDTISRLEEYLQGMSPSGRRENGGHDDDLDSDSDAVPVTDVQKLFLNRSVDNPKFCALVGVSKYVGNPAKTPSAQQLHDACVKVWSAHSIFNTRFDLANLTMSDLGRVNMEWREVSVDDAGFEDACAEAEAQAWRDLDEVKPSDNEMPYCSIICVSVPGPKARIAFVSRTHHVLVDVFSSAILSRDAELVLAGQDLPPRPCFRAFARFLQKHKQANIDKAIRTFSDIVNNTPASSVFQPPRPLNPPPADAFDLVRLTSPVSMRKSVLDATARRLGITTSTMIYAAWALFLRSVTGWDRVGFSISLAGRTLPWPGGTESLVGPLLGTAPFGAQIPGDGAARVREWLVDAVHKTTLDVLEFDGLPNALPTALTTDRRTVTTIVLSFLDVPQLSSNWSYSDKQRHNYLLNWSIFQDGADGVSTVFEVQSRQIDLGWAERCDGGNGGGCLEAALRGDKNIGNPAVV
ncbi:hypothetical protein K4K56_011550 [Colletotrichum sp. SAR 10_98]|nr:hypothetical protein K4K56_011550 [Colletotrichum sp. SAR 10_98]